MNYLQRLANDQKFILIRLFILSFILGASILLQAYSIVTIVNAVFIEQRTFYEIVQYFYFLLAAILLRLLGQFMVGKIGGVLAAAVKLNVRLQLLEKWSETSIKQHVQFNTGEKVSLLIDTVDQLESYFRSYIPQVIKSVIIPVYILAVVFYIHPNSGWIMLLTAPFIPITYIIIGLQTKKKSEEQLMEMNKFSGKFLDLLQGLQTIRLFGQSKQQEDVLAKSNEQFMSRTLSVLKIAFASTLFIELITTLGIGLVALDIGFQMIVFKTLTFAPAFLVLTLAPEYYNSLKELGGAFHTGRGSLGAAQLIEQQLQEKTNPLTWGHETLPKMPNIELHKAVIAYENGTTIGPISCVIPSGKTVAFIGKTGHGKSSILNMLSSLIELDHGVVTLNNKPRQSYKKKDWIKQISYISQHPYIFSGTLRDNICMGASISDSDILKAIEYAHLKDWLLTLPHGLDIKLGEGGQGLSGGEKKRVAIARAFVKKPSIVFFDEPTAGLDILTERIIVQAIQALSQYATVVICSHQYESIQIADFIYLVEHGQIIAEGTHEEMKHNSFYLNMLREGKNNESIN